MPLRSNGYGQDRQRARVDGSRLRAAPTLRTLPSPVSQVSNGWSGVCVIFPLNLRAVPAPTTSFFDSVRPTCQGTLPFRSVLVNPARVSAEFDHDLPMT